MDKEHERLSNGVFLQLFERERFLRIGRRPNLSGRQIWSLRETWAKFIAGDPNSAGMVVFSRMFENYHRTKEKFDFMNESEESDMKKNNSNKCLFHVTRVMKFIGAVLDSIDRLEEVVPLLKQVGGRHGTKGYDIPAYYFTYFLEALRLCMQNKLPDWTPVMEKSWRELLDWMTVQLVQGQTEYNGAKD